MAPRFVNGRLDGRSNSEVIMALVKDKEPGRMFTYAEVGEALSAEAGWRYSHRQILAAVRNAGRRLLREQARVLRTVIGVGYKLAHATEHVPLAIDRNRRADVQFRRGLDILKHVHLEELDEQSRKAHEGHLMLTEALYLNQRALWRRQSKVEQVLQRLHERVDALVPKE